MLTMHWIADAQGRLHSAWDSAKTTPKTTTGPQAAPAAPAPKLRRV